MEAIVSAVAEKTGLDRSMIEQAVPAVLDFLKDKLPDSVGGMLDSVVDGEGFDAGDVMDNLKGGLGGLLGG